MFVISVSKFIDSCAVCCVQLAGWSAEKLWLISQLGQQTFLFSKMCRSSSGPTKLPVQFSLPSSDPGANGWGREVDHSSGMELHLHSTIYLTDMYSDVFVRLEVVCIDGQGGRAVMTTDGGGTVQVSLNVGIRCTSESSVTLRPLNPVHMYHLLLHDIAGALGSVYIP